MQRVQKSTKTKLKEFFSKREGKDFNNSKKFWRFYSNFINIKSNNKTNGIPSRLCAGDNVAEDSFSIGNLFNSYFTNIKSSSVANINDCIDYTDKRFANMFNDNFLDLPCEKFHFEKITYCDLITITEGMVLMEFRLKFF